MHRDLIGNDENYIRLLNYSKEVLLSINISDTTINYISHSVEHVLNFTIEKFINKRLNLFTDLIHPEDKEGAISSIMSFAMLNNNDFPLFSAVKHVIRPMTNV